MSSTKEFIAAASNAYGEAIVSNEPNVQELVVLCAMTSRMRVQSLPPTVACAEKIMRATIDTYFAPGKTIGELHGCRLRCALPESCTANKDLLNHVHWRV
jgi:hypothetical protein